MTPPHDSRVAAARAEARTARAALFDTLCQLRRRLAPRTIVADAAHDAMERVSAAIGDTGRTVRARPLALGVAAVVLGMALALRHRLHGAPPAPDEATKDGAES